MAGRKYICADCGFTAWCSSIIPCIRCGSREFKPTLKVELKPVKCPECGKTFTPNKHNRKVCGDDCKRARDKRFDLLTARKTPKFGNCRYCGEEFKRRTGTHVVCDRPECKERLRIDRNHDRNHGCGELLGPSKPDMPMRKCHDCGTKTMDYRCDRCRAKWRARNGASGLSGFSDLFAGGHINVAVAC